MELFDANGNKVEGYLSADEVAAKVAAEKAAWEATKPTTPPTPPAPAENEPPAWFKPFAEQVQRLSGNQTSTLVKDFVSGLDADKQKEFDAKFNSLSGYDETPEGIQRRAQDAYLLTTGQPYNANAVNMQNVVSSGNRPVKPEAPKAEVDEAFKSVFGISDEDVKKYGA